MGTKRTRWSLAVLAAAAFLTLGDTASAATITPTITTDEYTNNSECSLREAVRAATFDSNSQEDACVFDTHGGSDPVGDDTVLLNGAYTLTLAGTNEADGVNGDLDPNTGDGFVDAAPDNKLTFLDPASASSIDGQGIGESVIDRQGPADGELILDGVDVLNGSGAGGGGIRMITNGALTLHDSKVLHNDSTGAGGGIYLGTSGSLVADEGSVISDNESAANGGGGIGSGVGSISLTDTQVTDNRALGNIAGNGGGIETLGPVEVHGGVFSGNSAGRSGGAISQETSSAFTVSIDGGARIGTPADPNTATLLGGGIHIQDGNLSLDGARVEGNEVNAPPATINTYRGGGISLGNNANATISRSHITGNSVTASSGVAASASGGGIGVGTGSNPLTIADSVIADNEASSPTSTSFGAGLYVEGGGGATLTNVTVTDNTAASPSNGLGAVTAVAGATVGLSHVTVAGNHSSSGVAGIVNSGATLTVRGSIISAGGAPGTPECAGTITSQGYNLDEGTTCGFLASEVTDTSLESADPQLGLFADHDADGLAESLALAPGSPAADLIPNALCTVAEDIRGYSRPQPAGGACDAGSYELRTCDGAPFDGAAGAACPVPAPPGGGGQPPATNPPVQPKKCKKGKKLKKGRCVKKKRKKKKKR